MQLDQVIKSRRSIRIYNEREIEQSKIEAIVEAGMWAPTACNRQKAKYIIITDKNIFNRIINMGSAHFLKKTNLAILVVYDNQIDNVEYQDHIQSASAGIQNMLLKASELEIGTCWICNLPPKKYLRKILGIPFNYDPIALISMGYYDKKQNEMKRKSHIKDVMSYNRFDFEKEDIPVLNIKLKIKRILRKIYVRIPKNQFIRDCAERFEKKFDN